MMMAMDDHWIGVSVILDKKAAMIGIGIALAGGALMASQAGASPIFTEGPGSSILNSAYTPEVVQHGQLLTGRLEIQNTSKQPGNFVVSAAMYYKYPSGGQLIEGRAGRFFPTTENWCNKDVPAGADLMTVAIAAGEKKTVTMFKSNFACGINTAFDSGQQFKVVWQVTCSETGLLVSRVDNKAFQYNRR